VVGHGAEHVGGLDVLLDQQFLVGGIARQHHGLVELLGDRAGALAVALDQLHLVGGLQRAREPHADVAAAGDDDPPHRAIQLAQLVDHRADIGARRDEEHLVVRLDDGVAARHDRLATAVDCRHTGVHVRNMRAQRAQLLADQRAAVERLHRHQPHPSAGEIQHLQRTRVLDQAADVIHHQLLGRDQHVDGQRVLGEQLRRVEVLGGADAGDLGGRAVERVADLAGDHVGLVTVGDGNHHVGVLRACLVEHGGVGGVAVHGADVQPLLQVLQELGVAVHHRDVVGLLAGEAVRHGRPDLPRTEDENLHGARTLRTRAVACKPRLVSSVDRRHLIIESAPATAVTCRPRPFRMRTVPTRKGVYMRFGPITGLLAAALTAALLAACGGGGGKGGDDNPGGSKDTTPDAFDFGVLDNAAPGIFHLSQAITVSGVSADVDIPITIEGEGCAYSTGGGFSTETGNVRNGDIVRVLLKAPAAPETEAACTVDIGGIAGSFTLTTGRNAFAMDVIPGHLVFTWAGFNGVGNYQLLRVNNASGETEMVANILGNVNSYKLGIPVHLTDWHN